jgi:hypothetical protein
LVSIVYVCRMVGRINGHFLQAAEAVMQVSHASAGDAIAPANAAGAAVCGVACKQQRQSCR